MAGRGPWCPLCTPPLPPCRRDASGQLYYSFEFVIQAPTFERHNISVLTSRDNLLFTMTVQVGSAVGWDGDEARRAGARGRGRA